jgi:hypothetical protein
MYAVRCVVVALIDIVAWMMLLLLIGAAVT